MAKIKQKILILLTLSLVVQGCNFHNTDVKNKFVTNVYVCSDSIIEESLESRSGSYNFIEIGKNKETVLYKNLADTIFFKKNIFYWKIKNENAIVNSEVYLFCRNDTVFEYRFHELYNPGNYQALSLTKFHLNEYVTYSGQISCTDTSDIIANIYDYSFDKKIINRRKEMEYNMYTKNVYLLGSFFN